MAKGYVRIPKDEENKDCPDEYRIPQRRSWSRHALQILSIFCAAVLGFVVRDITYQRCSSSSFEERVVPQGINLVKWTDELTMLTTIPKCHSVPL